MLNFLNIYKNLTISYIINLGNLIPNDTCILLRHLYNVKTSIWNWIWKYLWFIRYHSNNIDWLSILIIDGSFIIITVLFILLK